MVMVVVGIPADSVKCSILRPFQFSKKLLQFSANSAFQSLANLIHLKKLILCIPKHTNTLTFYFCIIQTRTKCYCLTNSFVEKKCMFNVDHTKREKLFYEIIKDNCKTFIGFPTFHHIIIKIMINE